MHWLSPFRCMEATWGPLEKRLKNDWYKKNTNFLEEQLSTLFLTTKGMKKFWRDEGRTSWRETKKMQIKLAKTFSKNGQQQDAKYKAEL
jgi:hypothetical protein